MENTLIFKTIDGVEFQVTNEISKMFNSIANRMSGKLYYILIYRVNK